METRKVVVTGMGMVTPLAFNAQESFDRLLEGRSAITDAPDAIRTLLPSAVAAVVKEGWGSDLADSNLMDRATQFAVVAARQAANDAGLVIKEEEEARAGAYAGIGMGGAVTTEGAY